MDRSSHLRPAVWPWFVVLFCCVTLVAGCQDGSGPTLVTSPEKPAFDGVRPPPPPPPDPQIATSDAGSAQSIYVMNADGSNYRRVIYVGGLVIALSWSPDGTAITYVTLGMYGVEGGIWIVNTDGSNNRLLIDSMDVGGRDCETATWSPLGTEIAFVVRDSGTGIQEVMVVPVGGGIPSTIYSVPHPAEAGVLEWNYDGSKLIYGLDNDLIVIDRATGAGTTVLSDFGQGIWWVDWGRQGLDTILFTVDTGVRNEIYTLDISSPGATPQFVTDGLEASFSPDNSKFVYHWFGRMNGWHRSKQDLAIYTFATGEAEHFNQVTCFHPDWRR